MVESRLVLFYIRHLCHYTRPLRCRHRGVPREYVYTLGSCQHALYYTPDTLKYMLRTSCAHLYMDQSNRPALLHRIVCETYRFGQHIESRLAESGELGTGLQVKPLLDITVPENDEPVRKIALASIKNM